MISALRSGRLRRRPRRRGENAKRRNVLGDITPISARPPEAADRAVPGHWEGDLIMGAFNPSAIVTVVERRSRFLLLGDLPEGHDAQSVYECLLELCGDLPELTRRSLTWDQGREMANWPQLQLDADIDVFFCDPHSPWQRPSNEHMNGLLRQYFPKRTDLNKISHDHLKAVAFEMNRRPRIVLGWHTPAEVSMWDLLSSQRTRGLRRLPYWSSARAAGDLGSRDGRGIPGPRGSGWSTTDEDTRHRSARPGDNGVDTMSVFSLNGES